MIVKLIIFILSLVIFFLNTHLIGRVLQNFSRVRRGALWVR